MDAAAQDALWGALIRDIQVEVPPSLDRTTAEQLLGLRPGDRLDAAQVQRGVRRLVLLGKLADVRVYAVPLPTGPDSVRLVVQVVGANLVRDVRITGVKDVPLSVLRRELPLNEGDPADDAALENSRQALGNTLAQEGYPDAVVEASLTPMAGEGAVAANFQVKQGSPQKVAGVMLEGDLRYPQPQLLEKVDLAPGGLASRSRLEQSAQRLLDWYRKAGHYAAKVQVMPVPRRRNPREWVTLRMQVHAGPRFVVSFRGNHVFRSSALQGRLGLPPDRALDAELVGVLEERVRKAYRDAGYLHVRVSLRAAPGTEKGTKRMLFSISEGPFTDLASVKLKVNARKQEEVAAPPPPELRQSKPYKAVPVPERELVDEAVLAASESLPPESPINQRMDERDINAILSSGDSEDGQQPQQQPASPSTATEYPRYWWAGLFGYGTDASHVYDRKRFEAGARAMEDYYRSRGYLQPRVQGPVEKFGQDGARVDVSYTATPGVQTFLASVGFSGNTSVDSHELLELAKETRAVSAVEPGAPMDLFAVEQVRLGIQELYLNRGYPFVRVMDDVGYTQDKRYALLRYLVEEGPLVHVKDLQVRGNAVTRDLVILQQTTLKAGEPFRKRDVEESRRKILGLGLFSSVTIELAKDVQGGQRTVFIDVRERSFGEFEYLVGASSEQGPRTSVSVTHRNLAGLGIVGGARGRINWPYPTYFLIQNATLRNSLLNRFNDLQALPLPSSVEPLVPAPVKERFDQEPFPTMKENALFLVRPLLFTEFELALSASYPRLLFVPFDAGLRAELVAARANRLAYNLDKAGLIFTADAKAPPFKYLRASTSPNFSAQVTRLNCQAQIQFGKDSFGRTCAQDLTSDTRKLDSGALGLLTWRVPVTLDGRDNIFRPHAGYLATGTADLVLGGGSLFLASVRDCSVLTTAEEQAQCQADNDQQARNARSLLPWEFLATQQNWVRSTFVRVAGGITGYLPLTRTWTLAVNGRGGLIIPLGSTDANQAFPHYVPLFERFYLGGSDSVRGFTPDGVLASDDPSAEPVAPDGTLRTRPVVSQGGNAFWNTRAELRIPVTSVVEIGIFTDAGQLILTPFSGGSWNLSRLSLGSGAGLRLNTPVGPLVFDVGVAFWDGAWPFQWSDATRRVVIHPALGYF